ncbi:MAG: hypothetical protein ACR2JO_09925 [Mycobacteriales bacterium]
MAAAEQIRQDADTRISKIRQQTRIKPEVIRAAVARVHQTSQRQMADLQASAAQQSAAEQRRLTAKAFGIDDIADHAVDRATLAVGYRDAMDRVAGLETVREAEEMLNRAEATGDELLARAIAQRAFTQRQVDTSWQEPLNSYLATRPHADEAISALLDAAPRTPQIGHLLAFALPEPDELRGLRPDQVMALTEAYPEVG